MMVLLISNTYAQQPPTVSMSDQSLCLGDSAAITVTGTPPMDIQFKTMKNGTWVSDSTNKTEANATVFNRHLEATDIIGGIAKIASADYGVFEFHLVSIADVNGVNNANNTATVTVNPLPTIKMEGLDVNNSATICLGDSMELTLTGTPPFTLKYRDSRWGENTLPNIPGSIKIASEETGSFVFELLELIDGNGCKADTNNKTSNTVKAEVLVRDLPSVSMSDQAFCIGDSATITVTGIAPFDIQFKTKKNGVWVGGNNTEAGATVFNRHLEATDIIGGIA
ncbi:MAG: hypothetical protein LBH82_06610, partial [Bacteroidales bacterium]|nr:hypothetical protein [Bacteroidales bacterium]